MALNLRLHRFAGVALALWCTGGEPGASRSSFSHVHYTLGLPAGWEVAAWAPSEGKRRFAPVPRKDVQETSGQVYFADQQGNYFSVLVDRASDFEADTVWRVSARADDSSVRVDSEGAICNKPADPGYEGPCSAGNGSLEIGTIPPLDIQGHTYSFMFGNTERETGVDLEPFRELLRSLHVRGRRADSPSSR